MIIKWSHKLALFFLLAAPVLIPFFYLPLTTDYYQFNKLILFYLLTGLGMIFWLVYSIAAKTVRLTLSPILPPLFILAAAAVASTLINRPAGTELWLKHAGIYPAGLIFFILTSTLIQTAPQVKTTLFFISGSLAAAAVAGAVGWRLTGSDLNLLSLLVSWLPAVLVLAFKTGSGPKKIAYFLFAGLMLSSLILNGYPAFTGPAGQKPVLLPKNAGWVIAVDTLKTKLFLGAGPGRFGDSFTNFKPVSLNLTEHWNVLFSVSANVYLEILTTLGLTGLTAFIWLAAAAKTTGRRRPGTRITNSQLAILFTLFTQLGAGLLIPFTIVNWVLFFTSLALLTAAQKSKQAPQVKDIILTLTAISFVEPGQMQTGNGNGGLLPRLLALPLLLGLAVVWFHAAKLYAADYNFKKSLEAADNNQGKLTYDLQAKTIGLAPAVDRYRLIFSNTNLAIANSLAANANLSDQDRQTVAGLIQQAIREAKITTQLNPNKAANWTNLANIYRNLINFADGADQFAQAAYVRAIQLDPANPGLRLELGGLFYSAENYDPARDRFVEAIQLKANFANAYYNLSYVYQRQEKWLEAYQAMQQAAALVEPDSDDGIKVRNELNDLEQKLPKPAEPAQPENSGELAAPSPAPEPPAGLPQIEL